MRTYDLTPFQRSSVGFDRLFGLLDQVASGSLDASTYPPYNIERLAENQFRISMAVAGFAQSELSLEVKEGLLHVRGEKAEAERDRAYVHRGIATRSFQREFQLADYVEVKSADLRDGMLSIDLVREVPEKLKPRSIAIGGGATTAPRALDVAKAA
jgi:molecular chaperone IbpA